jgi:hypothetical protein
MKSFIHNLILKIAFRLGFEPIGNPQTAARRFLAAALESNPEETIGDFLTRHRKDPALTAFFLRMQRAAEKSVTYQNQREHFKSHDFLFGVPEEYVAQLT